MCSGSDSNMASSAAVDFQRLVFEEFVKSREGEKYNVSSSSPGCCIIEPSFSPSNNDENDSILSSLLCRPKAIRYMYELTLLLSLDGIGYVIHIRDMISKYSGRPCDEPREPRKRTHNIEMKENNVRAGCNRIVAKLNAASYIIQEANQNSILDVPDRESRKSRRVKDALFTQARHFYPNIMDCALHPLPDSTDVSERKGDDEEEEDKAPTFKLVANLIDG